MTKYNKTLTTKTTIIVLQFKKQIIFIISSRPKHIALHVDFLLRKNVRWQHFNFAKTFWTNDSKTAAIIIWTIYVRNNGWRNKSYCHNVRITIGCIKARGRKRLSGLEWQADRLGHHDNWVIGYSFMLRQGVHGYTGYTWVWTVYWRKRNMKE